MKNKKFRSRQRGIAIITILMVTAVLLVFGGAILTLVTSGGRQARRDESREVTLALADAGVQRIMLEMWTPFRTTEKFTWADAAYTNASTTNPLGLLTASLNGGRYAVRVVGFSKPAGSDSSYMRDVTIQSVGWLDVNGNGGSAPDAGEPAIAVEQHVRLSLTRAHVFDYAYFVNNYGWMTGFTQANLAVNGDMRANGNFTIDGGIVNGQVIGAPNANIYNTSGNAWGAPGTASVTNTTNQANTVYTAANLVGTRARQAYDPLKHGAKTSTTFAQWSDILYDQIPDSTVSVTSDIMYGSVIADATGTRQLSNQSTSLSTTPTTTLPMPDLSDITYYRDSVSATYKDPKATYADGTANPNYNQEPYIEVYDTTTLKYKRVTGQGSDPKGTINGSVGLIGTLAFPIKIHGPVTVTGDIAIKGYVSGQGTLYTGRNVHVIGDVKYSDPPSFSGTDPTAIDNANEKKTMLALCAGGSVMMGNTTAFSSGSPLNYMSPPFTQDRRDDSTGAIIPAFNASNSDTGYTMVGGGTPKKYQSLLGDTYINANASAVTQIDAVMYTNNTAGGLLGDGTATGFTINGSVISKDEAMVVNLGAGKMTLNYDSRIKERSLSSQPLIDINLPRTPALLLTGWKEKLP